MYISATQREEFASLRVSASPDDSTYYIGEDFTEAYSLEAGQTVDVPYDCFCILDGADPCVIYRGVKHKRNLTFVRESEVLARMGNVENNVDAMLAYYITVFISPYYFDSMEDLYPERHSDGYNVTTLGNKTDISGLFGFVLTQASSYGGGHGKPYGWLVYKDKLCPWKIENLQYSPNGMPVGLVYDWTWTDIQISFVYYNTKYYLRVAEDSEDSTKVYISVKSENLVANETVNNAVENETKPISSGGAYSLQQTLNNKIAAILQNLSSSTAWETTVSRDENNGMVQGKNVVRITANDTAARMLALGSLGENETDIFYVNFLGLSPYETIIMFPGCYTPEIVNANVGHSYCIEGTLPQIYDASKLYVMRIKDGFISVSETTYVEVSSYSPPSQDTHMGYQFVDLGLSVKWATMNVGAQEVTEVGDYFAWGETEAKGSYNWSSYLLGTSSSDLSKYNSTDGHTVLQDTDDAAKVNWGGNWKMPTMNAWDELCDNTKTEWTWYDDYENSGVSGFKVQSLVSGYTDKFIFLPAGGYKSGTKTISSSTVYYWSSSLYDGDKSKAYRVNASNKYNSDLDVYAVSFSNSSGTSRAFGLLARPVLPKH